MYFESFLVEIVPAKRGRPRLCMPKTVLSKSSDPAHQMFYSHILGFRKAPNRLARLFPEAWRAIAKAGCEVEYRFSRTGRIVCILDRVRRRFVFRAFRAAFRIGLISDSSPHHPV
jgi:hypothetical protein